MSKLTKVMERKKRNRPKSFEEKPSLLNAHVEINTSHGNVSVGITGSPVNLNLGRGDVILPPCGFSLNNLQTAKAGIL